jgi:hypothetical protein
LPITNTFEDFFAGSGIEHIARESAAVQNPVVEGAYVEGGAEFVLSRSGAELLHRAPHVMYKAFRWQV